MLQPSVEIDRVDITQEVPSPTKLRDLKDTSLFGNLNSGESVGPDQLNETFNSQFTSTLSTRLVAALHKHMRT
jgi:hypothetical protein